MIQKQSKRNRVRLSDGSAISMSSWNARIKKASDQFKLERSLSGQAYCENCKRTDGHLAVSHTVSRNDCKNDGRGEQAYNPDNMCLECNDCHLTWEGWRKISLDKFLRISNIDRKEMYLEKEWPDLHRIFKYRRYDTRTGKKLLP